MSDRRARDRARIVARVAMVAALVAAPVAPAVAAGATATAPAPGPGSGPGASAVAGPGAASGPDAGGAASATQDPAVQREAADAVLRDGGIYYLGQSLYRSAGIRPNETLSLRRNGTAVTPLFADADGEAMVNLQPRLREPGRYKLRDENGTTLAEFQVFEQSLVTVFDPGTVDGSDGDATSTLVVQSNRPEYDLRVTATRSGETVPASTLRSAFGRGDAIDTDGDGDPDVLELAGRNGQSLSVNLSPVGDGTVELSFSVPDTTANDTASVNVTGIGGGGDGGNGGSGDAVARIATPGGFVRDHRGDVFEIPLRLRNTRSATVYVGNRAFDYLVRATVVDANGDGRVRLRWNTDLAARRPAGEVFSVGSNDSLSGVTRLRGGFANDSRRLSPGRYPMNVTVGGRETARGTLDLLSADRVPRSVSVRQASGSTPPRRVVANASAGDAVPNGAYVVLRFRAAGLYSYIDSIRDLQARTKGVSVGVRETAASAGGGARTVIPLSSFTFEADPGNDSFYLYARTDRGRFETGDAYRARFRIDAARNPYVRSDVRRSATFRVVGVSGSIETGLDDVLRVQRDVERICGATTVSADGILSLSVSAADTGFERNVATTANDSGRYCAAVDLSSLSVGTDLSLTLVFRNQVLARADGAVVRRASVTLTNQTVAAGRIVTVDNATLPDGGFLVVRRADDGTVLGVSEVLPPGNSSDIEVLFDSELNRTTRVRVTVHRNTGDAAFAPNGSVDRPYEFRGTEVHDDATVQVETTNATPNMTTPDGTTTPDTTTTAGTTTTTTTGGGNDGGDATVDLETTTTPTTTTTATPATEDTGPPEPLPEPGFGPVVALVALLALALLAARRR